MERNFKMAEAFEIVKMKKIELSKDLDVSECESLIDKIEVLEDIKLAESQINNGLEIPHQDVKKRFSKRISSRNSYSP